MDAIQSPFAETQKLIRAQLIGFSFLHILAIAGLIFFHPAGGDLLICGLFYLLRRLGINAGYHRLFSHNSFTATPALRNFLAFCGTIAGEGPVSRWVSNHRQHHAHSDQENDIHSPKFRGLWYSHLGWLFDEQTMQNVLTLQKKVQLPKSLNFFDRNFNLIFGLQAPVFFTLGFLLHRLDARLFAGGLPLLCWAFGLTTVLNIHGTCAVNSWCHYSGTKNYPNPDNSHNHFWIAFFTLGEGWHNNHHRYPASARHGFKASEIDLTYQFIRLSQWLGLASDLKRPG